MGKFIFSFLVVALIVASPSRADEKKKCVFEGLQLGDISQGNGPFKMINKNDKYVGIPKMFKTYEKTLGKWDVRACKNSVLKTEVVSFVDHQAYTFYFTNKDECDGGNSYGLILGTKAQSPNEDKVIATITDGYVGCL